MATMTKADPIPLGRSAPARSAARRRRASSADVEWAATLAYAHECISRQPQAYQTLVVEQGGANLSGGRPRIVIPRAILQQPQQLNL